MVKREGIYINTHPKNYVKTATMNIGGCIIERTSIQDIKEETLARRA
ncbi:hypothetical protein NIGALANA_18 [Bacillus phage Nigalana]|uniref:Uncharacterized protein n=3 Tax=Wphvirus megatron TaxID=1987728 RepID=A0A1B1PBK5_9CAUD|nr:hypothetical protein QLX47_gp020 [Bacillus phage Eyuki]YP_009280822.1 hypothetical protein SAGEFAYGE_19 [Bacillus phage SageFayge]YP_009282410.1 hypothetical protein BI005_gp018 [Bacillus phage Nigalana]YP_009284960.1 hypothetical protein BIZ88_gp018 [Bacillus phage DirtyBetty]YP_009286894.1 hypothetical protein BI006_gp018 [Bacillus phage Nemo]AOZ62265.1 hypothetical protein SBP8a_15 [Bacillus phage SBP8a]ASR78630.1 hypothetical protein BUBS_18 [Bacillus phage Bubs]ASR79331.1 hypothetica